MFKNPLTSLTRRARLPLAAVAVIAGVALVIGGGTAYALTGHATKAAAVPPNASHSLAGCNPADRMPDNAYTNVGNFPGCPANESPFSLVTGIKSVSVVGDQLTITMADGSQASTALPSSGPVTATATTAITNDADSGNHGNWAVDTFTRSMTVTEHGAVAVADCGGNATNGITSCYYYTAAMTDTGSFITDPGADSPQAGVAINGVLSGTLSGGSNYEFYATSDTPTAADVPATFDASSGSGSSTWPEHFFPAGTSFGGMNEINWSYVYTAQTTCEQWTDAYNNSGGSLPADGDIAGVNTCKG